MVAVIIHETGWHWFKEFMARKDDQHRQALDAIYNSHSQSLYTLALSITHCKSAAEDAVHNAFSKLIVADLSSVNDQVAYAYRVVRNAAIDLQRSSDSHQAVRETIFNGYVPPPASTFTEPHDGVLTQERDEIIRQTISELPATTQQVILLKTYANLTFDQISEVMCVPKNTTATWYRRGIIQLQQKLKGQI